MNPIKRLVVSDTLKIFLATTIAAMMLMTLGGGAKEGASRGLPPLLVAQLMPYLVPEMLRFVIPGCLLYAVCSVYGRMAANYEIVALKSLGINPLVVVWPVLILAYGLSLFTFWMYDVCATWSRPNLRRLVASSVDEIAYSYLRANRCFRSRELSIVVKDVRDDELIHPIVTIETGEYQAPITLIAERARLRADVQAGRLRIECENGHLEMAGKGRLSFPGRHIQDVFLKDFNEISEDSLPPAALATGQLPVQVEKEQRYIARLRRMLAGFKHEAADPQRREQRQRELEYHQARLFRLQAETPRRLSNGFGCLCFALVGIPVAFQRRSADTMSIFFLCFLPILLLYYPLLMVGENLARQGILPQFSVWLADAVLVVMGYLLLSRSLQH